MDDHILFARTEKGRDELLGTAHALKPRPRQVLFLIGDAIGVGELRAKLPACQELDAILEQLWQGGFIGQVKSAGHAGVQEDVSAALDVLRGSRLDAARQHALRVLVALVGEQSPAYAKVSRAQDQPAFALAIAGAKKVLAAVASPAQANAFEGGVLAILNLPGSDQVPGFSPNPAKLNGIEAAKGHALEIVRSLVGERSPVYAKLDAAHNRGEFIEAVGAGKKVLAAVASSKQAQVFEAEVLARLEKH